MDILAANKKMRRTTGAEVVIDIVDTGVRDVSVLRGCVYVEPYRGKAASDSSSGALSGDKTVDYQDYSGHGTMVAYLAKQMYSPAVIHSYCAMPTDPRTGQRTLGEYVNAALEAIIERVKADKRRHVVNMSLGGEGSISVGNADIMHGLIRQLVALDVPVVCSAGNDGREAQLDRYPSCFQEPICVSAVSSNGIKANFSTWHNEVDFAELGVDVPVIDLYGNAMTERGTSLAAPIVAGKIAAMLGAHPDMTEPEVYAALKAHTVDLGATGYDPHCGWGWIASLDVAAGEDPPTQPSSDNNESGGDVVINKPNLKLIPKPRMNGEDVKYAQERLLIHGIKVDCDGIFGPATNDAVVAFQKANGITPDGIINDIVWTLLDADPIISPVNKQIKDFVKFLEGEVGSAYVWSAQGHMIDLITGNVTRQGTLVDSDYTTWVKNCEASSSNATRALNFIAKAKANGRTYIMCYDCSGLGMYWMQNIKGYCGDKTAATLYKECKKLNRVDLKVGDFVFRHNGIKISHIGYVTEVNNGDVTVIESMGRDTGVVKRDINDSGTSYWNRYGRHPLLQETNIDPAPVAQAYSAVCTGDLVNVREGRGTSYTTLGKVMKQSPMLALPPVDGWCEISVVIDSKFVHGYMSASYVDKANFSN